MDIKLLEKIINEIQELSELENKSLERRIIKFNEEFGEFNAEVVKYLGDTPKPFDLPHLVEEGTDSLIVMLSIILKVCKIFDLSFNAFLYEAIRKNEKWREKIPNYTNQQ